MQVYVNQHDFFINRVREIQVSNDDEMWVPSRLQEGGLTERLFRRWESIQDPDAAVPTTESGLTALFTEIRNTVGQEAQIVQAVFPNPSLVMQVFLQRVFAQSVSAS